MQVIRPQEGPQEAFCASEADIAIYGGAAGSGKSWALCFEAGRFVELKGYNAILFRRESTEIRGGGGIWDESEALYPGLGGRPREHLFEWRFPSGARVEFSHLQHEKDKHSHQSKQYGVIGFDELVQFTESQFWYLQSRNRSKCGIRPYIRAATNPDPDSWVKRLIAWWLDEKSGLPIAERSGVLRWFIRLGDELVWADTKAELEEKYKEPPVQPRSLTFISAKLKDNAILLEKDPGYIATLMSLPFVERERLLGGNWNVRPAPGLYYKRSYFPFVDVAPVSVRARIRAWDLAATEPTKKNRDPDWTSGVLFSRASDGRYYVEHVERFRSSPFEVESRIKNIASSDGQSVPVRFWQDPGSGGKSHVAHLIAMLAGYDVRATPASHDKLWYAAPVSAQAEAGNISIVRGEWNDSFIRTLESFPGKEHDDDVDALSLAFKHVVNVEPMEVAVTTDVNDRGDVYAV